MRPAGHRSGRNQRGVALFLALVVLLIITVLGVSAVQTTTLQERMAANARDRDLAFQAAEAALARAETDLAARGAPQLVGFPEARDTPPDFRNPRAAITVVALASGAVPGVAEQPSYVIEHLADVQQDKGKLNMSNVGAKVGATARIFRITAHGIGGSDRAVVELQTTYGTIL